MMEQASSSKVTVEYHDPFNVYQLLSPGLLPRLPLRNLHWDSHAGPLRSINSLHIDLISATEPRPPSSAANADLTRVKSNESGDDGFRAQSLGAIAGDKAESRIERPIGPVKGRRHQIPGLRQTPYLKVFLLRCDDNETYKATARKQVREWIKEHTPSTQSISKLNAQENHDAFEWLIIHVVVPNTAAATQPKTTTKGTTPLLEKLRADFNSTSKRSVDRVAQIRIGINDVPYDILPRVVPAIPGSNSYTETPQEHQEAWNDLILKLKTLILSSFDMRVSQYEEDIKERDAQRNLPGWNFCTFFVLKEGLARGFESVGLVEDALVGYDELSVGLEAITKQQSSGAIGAATASAFAPFTQDVKGLIEATKKSILQDQGIQSETDGPIDLQNSSTGAVIDDEIPLSASRKNYRELVLSNEISLFDFRCYLFSRQLSLLLRLANASISKEELLAKLKEQRDSNLQGVAARSAPTQPPDEVENLSILGEVCKRTLAFIALTTRIMREDLEASQSQSDGKANGSISDPIILKAIDNVLASFTFSVAQQILAQTSTKSLPIPPSTLAPPSEVPGQEQKAATIPEPKTMMHPARSSSLLLAQPPREPPSPGVFPGGSGGILEAPSAKAFQLLKPGLEELAAHRAELYLLSRGVLERLGQELDWSVGWHDTFNGIAGASKGMEEIPLSDDESQVSSSKLKSPPTLHGLSNSLLKVALSSKGDFYRLYETFTDKALRHYTVASHSDSVQTAMVDLAVLKYHLKDYAVAASYLYRMTPYYGEGGWEEVEMSLLVMYTRCLKELKRNTEYTKVCLKLLGKAADQERDRLKRSSFLKLSKYGGFSEGVNIDGYLTELIEVLKDAEQETTVSMQSLFATVEVENAAVFHDKKDSFSLVLRMRYLLSDQLPVQKVKVKLRPIIGGQARDISLESEELPTFERGLVSLHVHSSVVIPGVYVVQQLSLQAANLNVTYEIDAASSPVQPPYRFLNAPRIQLYQRPKSLDIGLLPSRYLHLSKTRTLELVLSSGWNEIESGELHIRAATAGLRLQTSQISQVSGDLCITKNSVPGEVHFKSLPRDQTVRLCLFFNLEHDSPEISLKVEISYTTPAGTFFFANQLKLSILLPLGVNVQDVFKHNALFSKFSISSANANPLRILGSKLENSERFTAARGADLTSPVTVFQKLPATLLYKITRRQSETAATKRDGANLALIISYLCLNEEIEEAIKQELEQVLTNTPYEAYTKLVAAAVSQELAARLSPLELERTALLNELSPSVLLNVRWNEYFIGLGKETTSNRDVASLLAVWLHDWCSTGSQIQLQPLNINADTLAKARSISIPVDIPPVSVVHTASLDIFSGSARAKSASAVLATTNAALSANLRIKCTRVWDTGSTPDTDADDLEFVYEVTAPADTWLLGGKRKGHFRVPHDKEPVIPTFSFPVTLIPIREGFLPYPSLDIRVVPPPKIARKDNEDDSDDEEDKQKEDAEVVPITCETDYKNAAEVVRVISGARKTTVSLDASGPQGGAWLLETEQSDIFVR